MGVSGYTGTVAPPWGGQEGLYAADYARINASLPLPMCRSAPPKGGD